MRIGIITIHFPYNYGAMLQAYSTKEYLEKKGHNVTIIDYRPYNIDKYYHFRWKNIFYYKRKFFYDLFKLHKIKRDNFEKFLNNKLLVNSMKFYKKNNYNIFDIVLVGSDQVWNPSITNNDKTYLLDFIDDEEVRKISYASSIALNQVNDDWMNTIGYYLKKFESISIREEQYVNYLEKITQKKIACVLDPTFLLSVNEWKLISNKPYNFEKDKYILVYMLQENKELIKQVYELKKEYGYTIVSIHSLRQMDDFADVFLNDVGPSEFLWLIDHSQFVVTNSFHGTVFSILFNKKFISIQHTETGSRMQNLLDCLEIVPNSNGIMEANSQNIIKLNEYIKESKKWLNESINQEKNIYE